MTPSIDSTNTQVKHNHKFVLYGEGNDQALDVEPKDQRHTGESPFARRDTENAQPDNYEYKPKRTTGILDKTYKYIESTPQIGREYIDVDLRDVLNNDELIHDLAVTVSERGVVFFRDQDKLSTEQHKQLINKLGLAGGKPATSGLHIHPTALAGGVLVGDKIDPELTFISSELSKKLLTDPKTGVYELNKGRAIETNWHTDLPFEPVTSDYTSLRLVETPSGSGTDDERAAPGGGPIGGAGGDTSWASGYALAEKVSPTFLKFLEGLTAEYSQQNFIKANRARGVEPYTAPRGAKENVGDVLLAQHPLVRTNPTTGWKSIYGIGNHFNRILGLTERESYIVERYLTDVLIANYDIQVRFKWNAGDLAIWDNRSVYHTPTKEGHLDSPRTGLRAVSVSERPFFDPKSKLRSEALEERAQESSAQIKLNV